MTLLSSEWALSLCALIQLLSIDPAPPHSVPLRAVSTLCPRLQECLLPEWRSSNPAGHDCKSFAVAPHSLSALKQYQVGARPLLFPTFPRRLPPIGLINELGIHVHPETTIRQEVGGRLSVFTPFPRPPQSMLTQPPGLRRNETKELRELRELREHDMHATYAGAAGTQAYRPFV